MTSLALWNTGWMIPPYGQTWWKLDRCILGGDKFKPKMAKTPSFGKIVGLMRGPYAKNTLFSLSCAMTSWSLYIRCCRGMVTFPSADGCPPYYLRNGWHYWKKYSHTTLRIRKTLSYGNGAAKKPLPQNLYMNTCLRRWIQMHSITYGNPRYPTK